MSSSLQLRSERNPDVGALPQHVARAIASPDTRLDGGLARSLSRSVPESVGSLARRPRGRGGVVPSSDPSERAAAVGPGVDRAPDWDFSRVRVHTGPEARESAGALGAEAYTVRNHVVFGEGAFRPHTSAGRRLLTHELGHVAQQRHQGAGDGAAIQRQEAPQKAPAPKTPAPKAPAAAPDGAALSSALSQHIHAAAMEGLKKGDAVSRLRKERLHLLPLPPLTVTIPGPPRPAMNLPGVPLHLTLGDLDPSLANLEPPSLQPPGPPPPPVPTPAQPAAPSGPPALGSPSSMFGSWTNSAQVLPRLHANVEQNTVLGGGSSGASLLSQGSVRVGAGKVLGHELELGAVGNVGQSEGGPVTGSGGVTVHTGSTSLDAGKFSSGLLGSATVGSGQLPSGRPGLVVNASLIPLFSKKIEAPSGKDEDQRQVDLNAGVAYSSAGSFGPGTAAPHLLSVPMLGQYTRPLDPHNSLSFEGQLQPGSTTDRSVYGARAGVGVGFANTPATGDQIPGFGLNANASLDVTNRGLAYSLVLTLTITDAFYLPWARRPPAGGD